MSTQAYARALVLEGPRRTRLAEMAVPAIGDDDGLLRVEACGLCGTDHEQWTGALAAAVPVVPGHETVGRIEAVGPSAAERWGVAVGDRVVVEPRQVCGACDRCLAGQGRRCRVHGPADSYGQISTTVPPGLWGGYAEVQYLSPHTVVHPVDPFLDPVVAAMFNAVANGIRWGVAVTRTGPGDVVVVLGPGMRGIVAALAAQRAGASFVAVVGRGRRDGERLATARRFGADLVVDVDAQRPPDVVLGASGRLADVVVDATANSPSAFELAVELAAPEGRICVAGIHGDHPVPSFRPDAVVTKQLSILGVLGARTEDFAAATALLAAEADRFASVPVLTAGLDGLADLLGVMAGDGPEPPPVFAALVPG